MVNVDVAVFAESNRMGIGLVIRDHRANFLAACRQGFDRITEPEITEAIAFRHAVYFVSALPYDKVIVASDSLNVVQKIKSANKDRSETGVLVEDIKHAARAIAFSFIHVSRNCNEVAHVLARSAVQLSESVWFHEAPEFIRASLCNDRLID